MELLLHQWEDLPELYRNTDKTEVTEIVIIDSQINYRGKLDTYESMGLRSKRIVIESEAEKSSLQIDEWRELEKRSTKAFFRAGAGVMLIAV